MGLLIYEILSDFQAWNSYNPKEIENLVKNKTLFFDKNIRYCG